MRMTLNWKDARIFNNSWSSFFSSSREMKSLHWNGLLSRAFSEDWFPQVNKSSSSLVWYLFLLITAWFRGPSKTICRIFFANGVPPSWRQYLCLKNNCLWLIIHCDLHISIHSIQKWWGIKLKLLNFLGMIIVIFIFPFIFDTAQAICTAVSVWLVCDQLYLCFILRPTSNADEITYLTYKRFPHHVHWRHFFYPLKRFPEISVCPVPPYNITKLTQKGYPSLFYYYLGLKDDDNFIGWGGEYQGDPLELLGTWDENMHQEKKNWLW